MSNLNLFTSYAQEENHFTNGLVNILGLSALDDPDFVTSFLCKALSVTSIGAINGFRVLQQIDGTADAELSGEDCRIRIETKIVSGTLRREQIDDHLERLRKHSESLKRLILLTPDDGNSNYVGKFVSIDNEQVIHLGWKAVYNHLREWVTRTTSATVFSEVVKHFLGRIRLRVFEQDIAGIIAKVAFGKKSGVYGDKYLTEMKNGRDGTPPDSTKALTERAENCCCTIAAGRRLRLRSRSEKSAAPTQRLIIRGQTSSSPASSWSTTFRSHWNALSRFPVFAISEKRERHFGISLMNNTYV